MAGCFHFHSRLIPYGRMKRVLTALQPSGVLHIGNYFGSIKQMVDAQGDHENLLFAVDYHAITVPQEPDMLRSNILFATAVYLAAGIDPSKTIVFQQSRVPAHTELAWILNCITHMGELERMTQFKDKTRGKKQERVSVGLFAYPVLMAADILLYDTNIVPVGEDQKQHVELARDLAERFNKTFGESFVVPDVQIQKQGARIMGLDDPTKKMSKSAESPKNYLSLMDDDKTIEKKIKSAVTDSGDEIVARADKPAMTNLLSIFSLVSGRTVKDLEKQYAGKGYAAFKGDLTSAVIAWLAPLREKIQSNLKDEKRLRAVLDNGAERANHLAEAKMKLVRERIGVTLSSL